jgi:PST family polysaccharide transporter
MAVASAVTVPSGQLIVRKYISQFSGIESAGLWEGINRISGMYLMVITTSLGVYFLPKLARLKTNFELKTELISVYKLLLPLLAFLTVVIFLFRHLIIRLLFSTDFAPMENLFLYQLIGDFFKIAGWVLGYLLLAKTLTKTYIFLEFFNFFLLVGICYLLTKNMGPLGACLGYALVYFIYLVILIVYFRKIIFSQGNENNLNSNLNS